MFNMDNLKQTIRTKVKGTTHYDIQWSRLFAEDILNLKRDCLNVYDANAIQVWYGDMMLGHVDKDIAAELAPLLDAKKANVTTKILEVTGGGDKNHGINIEISVHYLDTEHLSRPYLI